MNMLLMLMAVALAMALPVSAQVKPPTPGEFDEPATGLVFHYPVEMKVLDPQMAIEQGHIAVFGSMQTEAKQHEMAGRCMRPLLFSVLPSPDPQKDGRDSESTLLLFEFTPTNECKAGFKYKDDESVAGGLAQIAIQLPGAVALSKPLYFDYSKEKFHVSLAAFGDRRDESRSQPPGLLVTAGMRYHNHLFGWMIYAKHLQTFNQVTKSNILLEDGKTYPIVPFNLNEHLQLPSNLLK